MKKHLIFIVVIVMIFTFGCTKSNIYDGFKLEKRIYDSNGKAEFGYYIVDYIGDENDLVVPDYIDDIPVVGIDLEQDSYNFRSIVLPNTIMCILNRAFEGCNLTSILIPNSVKAIGSEAFLNCHNLTTISFEENSQLTTIGNHAFSHCCSLISIDIPSSVTEIREGIFEDCCNLRSITLPFIERNFLGSLASFLLGRTSANFPTSLKKVVIAGGNSIYISAFEDCSSLTSIEIADSVTSIDRDAFSGCSSLISIKMSNNVTSIGIDAFKDCSSLKSIKIPLSVTSIGEGAFSGCSSLTTVYYEGTIFDWLKISIDDNGILTSVERCYYSKTKPTTAGYYWHYDSEGNIVVWE